MAIKDTEPQQKSLPQPLGRTHCLITLWVKGNPDRIMSEDLPAVSTQMPYSLPNSNVYKAEHLFSAIMILFCSLHPFILVLVWLRRFCEMTYLCVALRMVPGTAATLTVPQ